MFPFESFIALVALEWSPHGMRLLVSSQMTRIDASVIALVTFEWFFAGVLSHNMNFQFTSCYA